MTDEKKKLPDIPAEAAAQIIAAAAKISGKAAGDLNLEQAIEILQDDNPNTYINNGAEDQQQGGTEPIKKEPTDDPAAHTYIETDENGRHSIRIDLPEYDPTLDPESPEFDREKWEEYQRQASESLKAAAERMEENFTKIMRRALEMIHPYLKAELQKPEYKGKKARDLFEVTATDDDGNPLETNLFTQAVAAAITAARAALDAAAAKEEPPHAAVKRAEIIEYPLDKPNSIIWNLLEKDTRGQISFDMASDKDKRKGLALPAYYAINFDALSDIPITKRLLPFDKLTYIAVGALFNAGNNVVTLSQIYYAMGYTGKKPGDSDRDKILESITKMRKADIFFDNAGEAEKYKYPHYKYTGYLLPCDICEAIVNGNRTEAAIRLLAEPPLLTFAKQRNQITTLGVKLLQAPISKTDANLQIQDYLLEQISRKKRGKSHSCRILFNTLYKHANITTPKQQQRAPAKIEKYLNHYKQQEFITRYTMEKDGITVHW